IARVKTAAKNSAPTKPPKRASTVRPSAEALREVGAEPAVGTEGHDDLVAGVLLTGVLHVDRTDLLAEVAHGHAGDVTLDRGRPDLGDLALDRHVLRRQGLVLGAQAHAVAHRQQPRLL